MTTALAQDLWRCQCEALLDLAAFVDEHGPGTDRPLPLLHWYIGPSATVHAEIHSLDRENGGGHRDPRAVITAYSEALDTGMVQHTDEVRARLMVRGQIGPPEGVDGAGRTDIVICARVPVPDHRRIGGQAFIP